MPSFFKGGHKNIKKVNKLIDPWKEKNPAKQQFTWKRKNSNNEASRIDYFLIQNYLIQRILKADIRPAIIKHTDHQAVSLSLDIKVTNRGKGYWKLNNSLLNDHMYQKLINEIIHNYVLESQNNLQNARTIWDLCKIEIKEQSIKYGIIKTKQYKNHLKELEDKLSKTITNNENEEEIKAIEKQLKMN